MPAPILCGQFGVSMRTRTRVRMHACSLSAHILTQHPRGREIRVSLRPSLLRFYCVRHYRRLVPLGKCWRREVAPTDLTIDKDAFPDLLSLERRKEMSCSSHDKYPNEEEFMWK